MGKDWFTKNNYFFWIMAIIIAILIFYISTLKFEPGIPGISIKSYLYHFGVFFMFNLYLIIALTKASIKNKNFIFIGTLISMMYAISDELHQYFVPGRFCSVNDFLIDSAGILLSGIIYIIVLNLSNFENLSKNSRKYKASNQII